MPIKILFQNVPQKAGYFCLYNNDTAGYICLYNGEGVTFEAWESAVPFV